MKVNCIETIAIGTNLTETSSNRGSDQKILLQNSVRRSDDDNFLEFATFRFTNRDNCNVKPQSKRCKKYTIWALTVILISLILSLGITLGSPKKPQPVESAAENQSIIDPTQNDINTPIDQEDPVDIPIEEPSLKPSYLRIDPTNDGTPSTIKTSEPSYNTDKPTNMPSQKPITTSEPSYNTDEPTNTPLQKPITTPEPSYNTNKSTNIPSQKPVELTINPTKYDPPIPIKTSEPSYSTIQPTKTPSLNSTDVPLTIYPTDSNSVIIPITLEPTYAPTKRPSVSPVLTKLPVTTQSPISGDYCENGRIGNGLCKVKNQCCSIYGWCGNTPVHCQNTNPPIPLPPFLSPTKIPSSNALFIASPPTEKTIFLASPKLNNSSPLLTPDNYPYTIVLGSRERLLQGDGIFSPNREYSLKFKNDGSLVLEQLSSREILWRSVRGGVTLILQSDSNLVLKNEAKEVIWKSNTHVYPNAELILDDGGQLAVVSSRGTSLWLTGLPRGEYRENSVESIHFPLRGIFYYPWYPETWTVRGKHVFYEPYLGYYSSSDADIQQEHVDALEYMHADVAISSWFGPNTNNDKARLTNLMVKSSRSKRTKWTIYHEKEYREDQSVDEIRLDLAYIKKWFAWRDSWAYIEGKPLIYVYNEGGCDVAQRWMEASQGEWYVVLKVFDKDEECSVQPNGWHQYGPIQKVQHHPGRSYAISPGFWRADKLEPDLPRYGEKEWRRVVTDMVDSNEPWQLIVSFNEWGEGTAIEAARDWKSETPNTTDGYYLDALHDIH